MALCTQAELEIHMQISFGASPEDAVTQFIESASALIEAAAGQPLTEAVVTGELHSGGLPSLWTVRTPVDLGEMITVTEAGTTLVEDTEFQMTSTGQVIRLAGSLTAYSRWAVGVENIAVTYTGGPVADGDTARLVRSICLEVVARAFKKAASWANSPDMADFVSRIKLDTDEAEFREEALGVIGTSIELLEEEMAQIAYVRRPVFA